MVGCQIRYHGDMGTAGHGHQLEAGQLQHRVVRLQHTVRLAQQRMPDVAAHPHALTGTFQQLGDDGGGGRLAVGAGHGDDGARADPEENLHLAGQVRPARHARGDLRYVRAQTGGAEDHVRIQPLEVVLTQVQRTAPAFQLLRLLPHLLPRALVAGGDADPLRQQHIQQRRVADADTDDRHTLISNRVHIFPQGHRCLPPQSFYLTNILYRNRRDFQLAFSSGNPENPLWRSTAVILHKSG